MGLTEREQADSANLARGVAIEQAAQQMCTFCRRGIPIRPTELLGPFTHTAPEGYERCRAILIRSLASTDAAQALAAHDAKLIGEKNCAYGERDMLVCALSKLFPSSLERHPDSDTSWENDWRWIVFIELPTGQATWHIHDSELPQFSHLKRFTGKVWDGHTTAEKYMRVAALAESQPAPATQAPTQRAGARKGNPR